MRFVRAASLVHKWLALIVGVQMLLWIASGLFFTLYPIERVRSEHRLRELPAATLDAAATAPILAAIAAGPAPTKVSFEQRPEGLFAVAEYAGGRPALFDAAGTQISPIGMERAMEIAQSRIDTSAPISHVKLIEAESPEYRGALPAWRVQFADAEGLAVYVAADTGVLTARRSDLWRLYDALWAVHIMDWRDHENFNHGLIIVTAALSLIVAIAGFVLFPSRLLR